MRAWFAVCSLVVLVGCGDNDGGLAADAADAGGDATIDAGCTGSECCAEDSECDDGVFCNGTETCEASRCTAGTVVECDDSISCTTDRCDEPTRMCVWATVDADGDGHGDARCRDDRNEPLGDDCDDDNADRYPGNVELCDAIDQDCDLLTFGDKDNDGDGSIDDTCCNPDETAPDGRRCGFDCDDEDIARHRRQMEFCDQKDNDCDETVDEDPGVVQWYADNDQDGVGALPVVEETCQLRPLLSLRSTDCDDDNPAVRTGFPEFCDGIDNNCNGVIDERLVNCTTTEDETAKTIDECLNGLSNCGEYATCEDTLAAFTCACDAGFMGDGLTCVAIGPCSISNGGCDALATCKEEIDGARTCTCPNGYTSADNGMTCTDLDECATNNGGCGDAMHWTCANNVGAAPTCTDVDECATNNGGCDVLTTCENNAGCSACPNGYLGDGLTGCRVPASCKALFDSSFALSGQYLIDPDGAGAIEPFQAHCDLEGAGGGWTLIRSSVSGGTDASVEGLPTPATNSHLSATRMRAVAAISEQVHIRTSGDPNDAITSNVGTQPILSMRAGVRMYSEVDANCEYHPMADWTGPGNRLGLQYTCCPEVGAYPNGVFHSCNYGSGLTWMHNANGWTYGSTNSLEMYFR